MDKYTPVQAGWDKVISGDIYLGEMYKLEIMIHLQYYNSNFMDYHESVTFGWYLVWDI